MTIGWDFPRGITSTAVLAAFAAEHGVGTDEVLAGTGIDAAQLDDPLALVDARQELGVVRNLLRATGCDALGAAELGLAAGSRYHATSYGIWGYAVTSSRTVREAMELGLRFVELTYVFCLPSLHVGAAVAELRCHDDDVPADVRPFFVARDLAAIFTLVREQAGDPSPRFIDVSVCLPEPEVTAPHVAALGLEPQFAATTRVRLPLDLLDQPMPQANEHTAALCERQCRDLLAERRTAGGVRRRVRQRLAARGAGTAMETVAADLATTARTLRRKLTAEGTTFRALVDEVREAEAEDLLLRRQLPVEQIAYRLGYAEASSFIHAFTRWKGMSPRAYRASR